MLDRILIDTRAFAEEQRSLQGKTAVNHLDERAWSQDLADLSSEISFSLQGGKDRWQRLFLDLEVRGTLPLRCQRCMQPLDFALDERAHIVLFDNEAQLDEAMLADEELEGMVAEAETDVSALLEDQILMALPYSPKHESCGTTAASAVSQSEPNPFSVLAGLKKTD